MALLAALALSACASMEVDETHQRLPDNTSLSFTRLRDEHPFGIDSTAVVVAHCSPCCCRLLDVSHDYEEGDVRSLFHGAGTAAVDVGGFVAGEALRRPDRVNISTTGGSASATGGNASSKSLSTSSARASARAVSQQHTRTHRKHNRHMHEHEKHKESY